MTWNEGLQGPALEIAQSEEKVIRVVAGPGTGKTFSLMRRLARLLEEGIDPSAILLVTFTRVAAQDLAKAIQELNVEGSEEVRSGTLHSLCHEILSQNQVNELTGRVPRMLFEFEKKFLFQDLQDEKFGGLRQKSERLKAFEAAWARRQDEEPGWPSDPIDKRFNAALLEWLTFHEAMILGELVPRTLRFLIDNPQSEVLSQYSHVLIDEYQDLNKAEQRLLDLISENASVTVIGDEDQSIYENLKHANPEGISQFHESHPNTQDIPIIECRRCPSTVVAIANSLISHNRNRTERELSLFPDNDEGVVDIVQWITLVEEVEGVADYIESNLRAKRFTRNEVLVLTPRRHIGYMVRDELRHRGINAHSFYREPFLDGNPRESDRNQILEAFILMQMLENPEDRVALRNWLGLNSSSLLAAGYRRLVVAANDSKKAPKEILDQVIAGDREVPHTTAIVKRYRELLHRLEVLNGLVAEEKYEELFPVDADWALAVRELISDQIDQSEFSISKVYDLISTYSTRPELPSDVDYIRIMSLQKSKGLTAKHVIVTNCVQGLNPSVNETEQIARMRELEEARRLFYVAITRTKDSLLLTSSHTLPFDLAMQMRAKTGRLLAENVVTAIGSQFLGELGPAAPSPVRAQDWEPSILQR